MYRNPKKPRARSCSEETNPQHKQMFAEGIEWAEQFRDKTEDLHIVNDGLNLYGQYINLGFDKCAFILQGRTESLLYSYYFADAYAKSGHNILVVDTRGHGLSDGKYITAGVLEYTDIIKWIGYVSERYKIVDFTIHGICMGAANAIYAFSEMKNGERQLIKRLVVDGIYKNYFEIFKYHHVERKKPVFPFVHLVFFYAFLLSKARLFKKTPLKYIKNIDIPTLFIWSEQDFYCKKDKCEEIFAACASENKEKCYFPVGRHSYVRVNQPEAYDSAITEFLEKHA